MRNSKTLQEVIKYLSYSMEMGEKVRRVEKRMSKNTPVFTDLTQGMSALEVALEYFKLAEEGLREEEKKKQDEQNDEERIQQ